VLVSLLRALLMAASAPHTTRGLSAVGPDVDQLLAVIALR
jgi:hypothetical protein